MACIGLLGQENAPSFRPRPPKGVELPIRFFDLDACMFGGKRKKRTRLASSANLSGPTLSCDNSHPHLPWAIREVDDKLAFDTAAEAQYPQGLRRALVQIFVERFELAGGLLKPPGDFSSLRAGPAREQPPLVPRSWRLKSPRVISLSSLPRIRGAFHKARTVLKAEAT